MNNDYFYRDDFSYLNENKFKFLRHELGKLQDFYQKNGYTDFNGYRQITEFIIKDIYDKCVNNFSRYLYMRKNRFFKALKKLNNNNPAAFDYLGALRLLKRLPTGRLFSVQDRSGKWVNVIDELIEVRNIGNRYSHFNEYKFNEVKKKKDRVTMIYGLNLVCTYLNSFDYKLRKFKTYAGQKEQAYREGMEARRLNKKTGATRGHSSKERNQQTPTSAWSKSLQLFKSFFNSFFGRRKL